MRENMASTIAALLEHATDEELSNVYHFVIHRIAVKGCGDGGERA